ncbi:DUF1572 family protein [Zobellia galactanivorans]|uniref:DUF1572 family protein n=1 Tax=Zobellia galactanivorans (strain DSM 12802 / CCUG 47099 / CIP 106680 / NCIMB 13871 / Dsij) TaxID=63186 RepID=UPI0026E321FF|nr:DUF1572 family protein [Zobellia galactanivorans]MDO6810231.1 DUF1572 family protein [Zobellia galactanivorans]
MSYQEHFLNSAISEFRKYKGMGDKTFAQLSDEDLLWQPSEHSNCISQIVKHMVGNMLSRWTNFLTEDGEKSWRNRESEFEAPYMTKSEMSIAWEAGWQCLFNALDSVSPENFDHPIKIRNESHSIVEAIHRQLAHYSGHVGQIVLLAKIRKGENWVSLSIPNGGSEQFNRTMFNN